MIEACITCSSPCEIRDLGLTLRRGEELWVADLVALNSRDLQREIARGNVRVTRKTRKPDAVGRHVPPFVALHRAPGPGVQQTPRTPEPPKQEALDVDEIARRVRDSLLGDVRATVADEISRALSTQSAGMDPTQLASMLEGVIRRVMPTVVPGVGPSAATRPAAVVADEPLYLPTNIVDKGAKGKVVVESQAAEDDGAIDETAAALRSLKKTHRDREE